MFTDVNLPLNKNNQNPQMQNKIKGIKMKERKTEINFSTVFGKKS
jgi:hypothetical protein